MNKVPFRLYGGVDHELRVLAQYSKQSVLPENYIALLGDSNSIGVGDFYIDLTKNSKKWYPDYSPAHFINKKVGADVVSFGFAGAGTIDGVGSGPAKYTAPIFAILATRYPISFPVSPVALYILLI